MPFFSMLRRTRKKERSVSVSKSKSKSKSKSVSKSKSKSKSVSNSFTRKRKAISRRFLTNIRSKMTKSKLKKTLVTAINIANNSDVCAICILKMKLGEPLIKLGCTHMFHSECLYNVINRTKDNRCPLCRTIIDPTSLDMSKINPHIIPYINVSNEEPIPHEELIPNNRDSALYNMLFAWNDLESSTTIMNNELTRWDEASTYLQQLIRDRELAITNETQDELEARIIIAREAVSEARNAYNIALQLHDNDVEAYLASTRHYDSIVQIL